MKKAVNSKNNMANQKKFNDIINFQLHLSDDDTREDIRSVKFTKLGSFLFILTAFVVMFALAFLTIAYTPLRTLIPGYPNAQTKHDAIQSTIRIDSLESVILKWEFYSENLRRVVAGQDPLPVDSLMKMKDKESGAPVPAKEIAEKEARLKEIVTGEDKFNIQNKGQRSLPIEGMHFFVPLKGVVSQGYDKALHPYIDITAPGNSVVMSVLDGTVIQAGWSDEDGYTIRIQHEGDLISVYKHNQKLMKKTGDRVTAGTPVAIVGGTGTSADGDHLHFELWHKGETVDPTKYISL